MPRRCIHEGCTTRASFGYRQPPNFCCKHAMAGMQDVRRKRYRREAEGPDNSDGCFKAASYGFVGRTAEMCSRHASSGMVNLRHKRCAHANCFTRPSRGSPISISMTAEFCSKHAPSESISIFSKERKKCARPGCSRKPSFGVKGCNRKTFCSLHATDVMVNIVVSENGAQATGNKATIVFDEKKGSGNKNPESCGNNANAGKLRSVARYTDRNSTETSAVVKHDGGNNEFTSDDIPAADLVIRGGGKWKELPFFQSLAVQEEPDPSVKRNRVRFEHPIPEPPPPSPTLQQPQRRQYHEQQRSPPAVRRWAPSIANEPVGAPAPPSPPLFNSLGEVEAEDIIRTTNPHRASPYDLETTACGNDGVRVLHGRPSFVAAPMSGHYGCQRGWFENFREEGIVIASMEERGVHDARSLTGGFGTVVMHDPHEGSNASRRVADRVGPSGRGGWRPVFGSDGRRSADGYGWGGDDYRENHDFGAEKRDLGGEGDCYPFKTFEEFKARRSVPGCGGESGSAVIRLGAPGQTSGVGGGIFTGQRQEQQQQRPEVLPPELQHHHQPQVDGRDR